MPDLTRREAAVMAVFRRVFGDALADEVTELTTKARSSSIGMVEEERKERERRAAERRREAEQNPEEKWWHK